MSARKFNYADNSNSAKIYCSFLIIGETEKIALPIGTQSKLSKEFWLSEIRAVLPEIKSFLLELLACVHKPGHGNTLPKVISVKSAVATAANHVTKKQTTSDLSFKAYAEREEQYFINIL